jgi:hypothetical protein
VLLVVDAAVELVLMALDLRALGRIEVAVIGAGLADLLLHGQVLGAAIITPTTTATAREMFFIMIVLLGLVPAVPASSLPA